MAYSRSPNGQHYHGSQRIEFYWGNWHIQATGASNPTHHIGRDDERSRELCLKLTTTSRLPLARLFQGS